MRKVAVLFFAVLFGLTGNIFAEKKLIDYVPSEANVMIFVKVKDILELPIFDTQNSGKDKVVKDELKKIGLSDNDGIPAEMIYFAGSNGDYGILVAAPWEQENLKQIMVSVAKDTEKFTVKNMDGRTVFERKDMGIIFTYLDKKVILLSGNETVLSKFVSAPKGGNKKLLSYTTPDDKKALIWMGYCNPEQQQSNSNDMFTGVESVGASFDFIGKTRKCLTLKAAITCKDNATAVELEEQMKSMVKLTFPIMLAGAPKLSDMLIKSVKFTLKDNNVNILMKVSQTSFKKILKYYTTRKTQEDVAREQKSEKRKSEIEKRREEENKFTASLGFIMGRYLAENCPGKVLVLAESDYKTSTYTKLVVGGLKEGLGKEAQVVVDTVKVPGYNMPEEEIPPLPDIMTARDFDAAVDGHPDCKVIVSMIWLSRDVENMKLWTKKIHQNLP